MPHIGACHIRKVTGNSSRTKYPVMPKAGGSLNLRTETKACTNNNDKQNITTRTLRGWGLQPNEDMNTTPPPKPGFPFRISSLVTVVNGAIPRRSPALSSLSSRHHAPTSLRYDSTWDPGIINKSWRRQDLKLNLFRQAAKPKAQWQSQAAEPLLPITGLSESLC